MAGVAAGLALAQGALSVLNRVQDGVPLPSLVQPTPGNLLVPVLVSVVVTVGAALVPARAATRVSPVAALRPADVPTVRGRPGRVRLTISLLLTVGGSRYALVAAGATVSPAPSAGQLRQLDEYAVRAEPVPDLASWWEVLARAGVAVR